MQNRERTDGQTVWTLVPLRDGRGLLIRSNPLGQPITLHLLLWQTRRPSLQVLINSETVHNGERDKEYYVLT